MESRCRHVDDPSEGACGQGQVEMGECLRRKVICSDSKNQKKACIWEFWVQQRVRLNMGQGTVEVYGIQVKSTFSREWMPQWMGIEPSNKESYVLKVEQKIQEKEGLCCGRCTSKKCSVHSNRISKAKELNATKLDNKQGSPSSMELLFLETLWHI